MAVYNKAVLTVKDVLLTVQQSVNSLRNGSLQTKARLDDAEDDILGCLPFKVGEWATT
jgi:hypothetical protein